MKKIKKKKYVNERSKEYMSKKIFNEARMIFLLKPNMIDTKASFKGQKINDLLCEICGKKNIRITISTVWDTRKNSNMSRLKIHHRKSEKIQHEAHSRRDK